MVNKKCPELVNFAKKILKTGFPGSKFRAKSKAPKSAKHFFIDKNKFRRGNFKKNFAQSFS